MTVREYAEQKKLELNRYAEYWENEQIKHPEDFPEHMDKEDWDENKESWEFVYRKK